MLPVGADDDGKRRGGAASEASDAAVSSSAASLNDLCATAAAGVPAAPAPFPRAAAWALAALLAVGLGVGVLVLAVVHSAALLSVSLVLSAAVAAFLLWNAAAAASGRALRLFVDGLPASSLRVATDGQLVKINGFVSCGDISLISSYEKVENCVYTSTLLKKCRRWGSKILINPRSRCSKWKLIHAERFAADFYITDAKSGKLALVKAGHNSKVLPLVDENILVTTSRDTELSSTLKYWLEEQNLSSEQAQLIRLEEGYIREGMRLSVVGILSKKNGEAMILPPPEPISTGCVFRSFLLPTYFDGIVLRFMDRSYFVPNPGVS